ncbi:hypothetical protein V8F20_010110 [Naviculisporaceae sp. PSN 640]
MCNAAPHWCQPGFLDLPVASQDFGGGPCSRIWDWVEPPAGCEQVTGSERPGRVTGWQKGFCGPSGWPRGVMPGFLWLLGSSGLQEGRQEGPHWLESLEGTHRDESFRFQVLPLEAELRTRWLSHQANARGHSQPAAHPVSRRDYSTLIVLRLFENCAYSPAVTRYISFTNQSNEAFIFVKTVRDCLSDQATDHSHRFTISQSSSEVEYQPLRQSPSEGWTLP